MAFQKGHTIGKGNHNSGRKTKEEEFEEAKEEMKKQTIEELATYKVFKSIGTLKGRDKRDRQGVKDIALPVYLKSKAEKQEIKLEYKQIYNGKSIQGHEGDKKDIQSDKESKGG